MLGEIKQFLNRYVVIKVLSMALVGAFLGVLIMLVIVGGGGVIANLALELGATDNGFEGVWIASSLIALVAVIVLVLVSFIED